MRSCPQIILMGVGVGGRRQRVFCFKAINAHPLLYGQLLTSLGRSSLKCLRLDTYSFFTTHSPYPPTRRTEPIFTLRWAEQKVSFLHKIIEESSIILAAKLNVSR